MKLLIKKENDNPNFIRNAEQIIVNRINLWKPNELFINRIDNWFDEKWMEFSGAIMQGLVIWKVETTIPPFHPNRVENSDFYQMTSEQYVKKENAKPLHIHQKSKNNLKRKILDFTDDGIFVWYSGNSKINGIGTIMCYHVKNSECRTFFITLTEEKGWDVSQTKGILVKEIQNILDEKTAESTMGNKELS
jgi:hypothetical protein